MAAPKKSPVGAIAFWFLTVCAVAALSNFKGRYTGWADRLAGGESPAAPTPATPASPTTQGGSSASPRTTGNTQTRKQPKQRIATSDVVDDSGTVKDVFPAGEFKAASMQETKENRSEAEKQFDDLYRKYLARLKPPKLGGEYTFRLRKGGSVTGVLEQLSPGAVVVRMEYGAITYPIHRIHDSAQALLFPQRAAKVAALKELNHAHLEAQRAEARKVAEAEARAAAEREAAIAAAQKANKPPPPRPKPVTTTQTMPPSGPRAAIPNLPAARGVITYDPSSGKTADHLKPPLTGFANWLQVQQRRMGGKIANKIYAKQPDRGRIVLYLQMHDNFLAQDYDWRFQISEGIWRIWALRGVDSGLINGPNHGHVVLVDSNNRIIGGSTPDNASNVWAERNL